MNLETRHAYFMLFTLLFKTIATVSRELVRFAYLDGGDEGIRTVVANMCKKQAPSKHILRIRLQCTDQLSS